MTWPVKEPQVINPKESQPAGMLSRGVFLLVLEIANFFDVLRQPARIDRDMHLIGVIIKELCFTYVDKQSWRICVGY